MQKPLIRHYEHQTLDSINSIDCSRICTSPPTPLAFWPPPPHMRTPRLLPPGRPHWRTARRSGSGGRSLRPAPDDAILAEVRCDMDRTVSQSEPQTVLDVSSVPATSYVKDLNCHMDIICSGLLGLPGGAYTACGIFLPPASCTGDGAA